MRDDGERLRDILEAIERIEKYQERGSKAFHSDELVQTWIVHHLQIVGEAVNKLSDELRKRHPEIPWPEIVAMRNVLVHDYFTVEGSLGSRGTRPARAEAEDRGAPEGAGARPVMWLPKAVAVGAVPGEDEVVFDSRQDGRSSPRMCCVTIDGYEKLLSAGWRSLEPMV